MLVTTSIFLLVINIAFAEEGPIISIDSGQIRGRTDQTVRKSQTYYAFQGIPYAEPPVGELRFAAPQHVKDWEGIHDATSNRAECKQISNPFSSEDCLFINVYTPSLTRRNLPVMVWIHGGKFTSGSSKSIYYGPDYFLENDVIVVTFNYRLGIFGFYTTEDNVAPGNWGLKDQVLALIWVNDNIAAFGGSPNRVTVFGQGAGAVSVNYLIQSPLTKGLFQGAILQSGSTLCPWALSQNKRKQMFNLGLLLGIFTRDPKVLLQKMRKVSMHRMDIISSGLEAKYMAINANPLHELIYAPVLEPESPQAVVTQRSYEQLDRGNFNKVPIIMGYNSQESLGWRNQLMIYKTFVKLGYLNNQMQYAPRMNIDESALKSIIGKSIVKQYNLDADNLDDENILKIISDVHFVRPINKAAHLYSKFAPVYLYRYSYVGNISKHFSESPGEGNKNEIPFLFYERRFIPTTDRDILTSNRLLALWTNFAKRRVPTSIPEPLLDNIIWPSVTPEFQYYLKIDDDLSIDMNPDFNSVRFWNNLFDIYGHRPYDTY